jgi:hypothetical protein
LLLAPTACFVWSRGRTLGWDVLGWDVHQTWQRAEGGGEGVRWLLSSGGADTQGWQLSARLGVLFCLHTNCLSRWLLMLLLLPPGR